MLAQDWMSECMVSPSFIRGIDIVSDIIGAEFTVFCFHKLMPKYCALLKITISLLFTKPEFF